MINKDLLKILVCPACKTTVKEIGETLLCTNSECRRQYTVKDNIPVMLIDESVVIERGVFDQAVK
ncbi:Trm112 family protein [bacterium]|nr:Trm112 family protein [bacterium]